MLMVCSVSAGALGTPKPSGKESWQILQSPTASQIAAVWQSPPPQYGPEPYYGLNGSVTLDQVERDLDTMKRLGFQAVTVQAGYNMPFSYLSPDYFAFFRQLVDEAKKRDMRVWIVDDAGYPSGFAGGRFTSDKPDLRMQALEVARKIPVAGGTTLHETLDPDTVQRRCNRCGRQRAAAGPPRRRPRLDRPRRPVDGPHRRSRIPHLAHTLRHQSARVKDTEQSLEDYMNPAATAQYLQWTHDAVQTLRRRRVR